MRRLSTHLYLLFGIAILLQVIPNIYIFGIPSSLLSASTLSLFCITIVGIVLALTNHKKFKNISDLESRVILLFILTQILSGINAVDFTSYLSQLLKISAGVEFYFVTRFLFQGVSKDKYNKYLRSLFYFFLAGGVLNIIFQLLLHLSPQYAPNILFFFSVNLKEVTQMHLQNNKIYSNFPIELLIPLLVIPFLNKRKNMTSLLSSAFLYLIIIYLAVVSNFRYRLLAIVFASFMTLVSFKSLLKEQLLKYFAISMLMIFVLSSIVFQISTKNTINRIVDPSEYTRIGTVAFRLRMQEAAVELGTHHIFGVGLGNFPLYIKESNPTLSVKSKSEIKFAAEGGPHNLFYQVFAESGCLGASVLLFLTILWAYRDLRESGKNSTRLILATVFWTLFVTAQFNPVYSITYFTLSFTIRGLITES